MRRLVLLCVLGSGGCGSSVLDGADAVPAGEVPSGQVLSLLTPSDCVDARGVAVARPATLIRVLVREDGKPLLIEERPGYDSLLVHNSFRDGGDLVFQAISTPEDADAALHEYRIEWPSAASGKLANARTFEATVQVGGSFRARASALSLTCRLVPTEPRPRLDNDGPVRYEEPQGPRASG